MVAIPSFAAGELETYLHQAPSVVSQLSRAEVRAEAVQAPHNFAESYQQGRTAPTLTRAEVRQAAVLANRNGQIPHGEGQF